MVLVVVLVCTVFLIAVSVFQLWYKLVRPYRKRHGAPVLGRVAELLGAPPPHATASSVTGRLDGVEMTFTALGAITQVDVHDAALAHADVGASWYGDEIGRFLEGVSGSPRECIDAALEGAPRAWLVSAKVDTSIRNAGGGIRFVREARVDDPEAAREMLAAAAAFAQQLRVALHSSYADYRGVVHARVAADDPAEALASDDPERRAKMG